MAAHEPLLGAEGSRTAAVDDLQKLCCWSEQVSNPLAIPLLHLLSATECV